MPQKSKKPRERAHLEAFRRAYSGFPSGVICETEEPDFVVQTPADTLGIEHTEFHWDEGNGVGSERKAQESQQEKIVNAAVRLYESRNLPSVIVRIHWHPGVQLSRRRVRELRPQLADVVAAHLPKTSPSVWINAEEEWGSLPDAIMTVGITRLGDPTENQWVSTRGGWVPQLGMTDLERRNAEKESRLAAYRSRCDEVWLLIVADGRAPSSFGEFPEAVRRQELHSAFDRLFFFRYFDGDYVELRRKSR